jgi:hypothetical protein
MELWNKSFERAVGAQDASSRLPPNRSLDSRARVLSGGPAFRRVLRTGRPPSQSGNLLETDNFDAPCLGGWYALTQTRAPLIARPASVAKKSITSANGGRRDPGRGIDIRHIGAILGRIDNPRRHGVDPPGVSRAIQTAPRDDVPTVHGSVTVLDA